MVDRRQQEGARAARRVQNDHRFTSQSIRDGKFLSQQPINASHDVISDRLRCEKNTAALSTLRLITVEKMFEKMSGGWPGRFACTRYRVLSTKYLSSFDRRPLPNRELPIKPRHRLCNIVRRRNN